MATNETVTVACKIPMGLTLRLFDMVETTEYLRDGGHRTIKQARDRGKTVTVRGPATHQSRAPDYPVIAGAALTANVPKDFWDEWLAQNKESEYVKNKMIFAQAKPESAASVAKETAELKSGLERLDPEKLPSGIQKHSEVH